MSKILRKSIKLFWQEWLFENLSIWSQLLKFSWQVERVCFFAWKIVTGDKRCWAGLQAMLAY